MIIKPITPPLHSGRPQPLALILGTQPYALALPLDIGVLEMLLAPLGARLALQPGFFLQVLCLLSLLGSDRCVHTSSTGEHCFRMEIVK